jgi:hypothetical protein
MRASYLVFFSHNSINRDKPTEWSLLLSVSIYCSLLELIRSLLDVGRNALSCYDRARQAF